MRFFLLLLSNRKAKKKRRKRRPRHHDDDDGGYANEMGSPERGQLPKALAPMPSKLKSMPPTEVILRPSSALEQRRSQVEKDHSLFWYFVQIMLSIFTMHIQS